MNKILNEFLLARDKFMPETHLTLIQAAGKGGGNFTPCWFSLNNSEMVKAITPEFCSI